MAVCDPPENNIFSAPIQAILADNNNNKYIDTTDNLWAHCTLSIWKNVITDYNLTKEIVLLKWYAMIKFLYQIKWTPDLNYGPLKE